MALTSLRARAHAAALPVALRWLAIILLLSPTGFGTLPILAQTPAEEEDAEETGAMTQGKVPIKNLMRDCATEPSMYYDSPSNSELEAVFENIAKGLNDLRLSK